MQDNLFQYCKSRHLDGVTLLHARMHDFSYRRHAHEEFSLGVTLAGRQDFWSEGGFYSSAPGNIILFNPGAVHDGHPGTDDSLYYRMVYIHPEQIVPMLQAAGMRNAGLFRSAETLLNDAHLRGAILQLAGLIEQGACGSLEHEQGLYSVAERLAQLQGNFEPARRNRHVDRLLLRAREFIHDNVRQELSLEQISEQAAMSKYHFLRLFRQNFGMTPHQYVLNNRLNRAREALAAGRPLQDVVYDTGFSDLSHLNRRFKPVFGMTPRQYQQVVLNG